MLAMAVDAVDGKGAPKLPASAEDTNVCFGCHKVTCYCTGELKTTQGQICY